MHYRIFSILTAFICLFGCVLTSAAQDANGTDNDAAKPVILYSGTPKKYEIAEIKVEGVKNYEDYVLIGLSGLSVGQTITIPGDEVTQACKRYWKHGLFSNVQITADKIEGDTSDSASACIRYPLSRREEVRARGYRKPDRYD